MKYTSPIVEVFKNTFIDPLQIVAISNGVDRVGLPSLLIDLSTGRRIYIRNGMMTKEEFIVDMDRLMLHQKNFYNNTNIEIRD